MITKNYSPTGSRNAIFTKKNSFTQKPISQKNKIVLGATAILGSLGLYFAWRQNWKQPSIQVQSTYSSAIFTGISVVSAAVYFFFGTRHEVTKEKSQSIITVAPSSIDNEHKLHKNKKIETPTINYKNDDSLKIKFLNKMNETMGSHLHPYQKNTLSNLFIQTMQTSEPQKSLVILINAQINQPQGWGTEKAEHIRKNLLPIMPISNSYKNVEQSFSVPFQFQIETISQTYIHSIDTKLVCFYKNGPTAFLGNFAQCSSGVQVYNQTFQCAEAAFQWRKYFLAATENNRQDLLNDPMMKQFFTCDGEKAFRLNKNLTEKYPNVFPKKWKQGQRDKVMWKVLNKKFSQNPGLSKLLKMTKGAYLLEHNQAPRDDYWSDNENGSGKNMLGKMLMAIRDGNSCPQANDATDQSNIRKYANYANQPGVLNYQIF